jgi:hypothetical protein
MVLLSCGKLLGPETLGGIRCSGTRGDIRRPVSFSRFLVSGELTEVYSLRSHTAFILLVGLSITAFGCGPLATLRVPVV